MMAHSLNDCLEYGVHYIFHDSLPGAPVSKKPMNPFDALVTLINEHGSASIMRDRILLLKEQFEAKLSASESSVAELVNQVNIQKGKIAELELQNEKLHSDNKALQLDNENLHQQNRNSGKQLKQENEHNLTLSEVEQSILMQLAQHQSMSASEVESTLGLAKTVAAYHLEELKNKGMICEERVPMVENIWSLCQLGRRFLLARRVIER